MGMVLATSSRKMDYPCMSKLETEANTSLNLYITFTAAHLQSICKLDASWIPSKGTFLIFKGCWFNFTAKQMNGQLPSSIIRGYCGTQRPGGLSMDTLIMMKKTMSLIFPCVSSLHNFPEFDTEYFAAGYSFFDSGDVQLLGQRKRQPYAHVGASSLVKLSPNWE